MIIVSVIYLEKLKYIGELLFSVGKWFKLIKDIIV